MRMIGNNLIIKRKSITVLTNVIPQKSLAGKSFATVFTNQRLCSKET